jgi:hypothetical protein
MISYGGTGTLIPGSRCPKCGEPLEYNGNYWCSDCPWVLPEFPRGADLNAFEVAYVLYMQQTGREPDVSVIRKD